MFFSLIARRLMVYTGLLAGVVLLAPSAQAYYPPYSALVVDADNGEVLLERNADEYRHPASLTKMMTLYMVFDALKQRRLQLRQLLWVSPQAALRPPSKLGLRAGDTLTVEDAILALVTRSANDAATTLAENLGGSEPTFARLMTLKARSLGMTNTTFRNASGLPDPFQVTTARDMYLLARALQRDFPQHYRYFSTPEFYYRGRRFHNHNHLLLNYPGTDGIKTGYIRASGYNLVASTQRGGRRIIGVVFGGESARARDEHMRLILSQSFAALGVGDDSYRFVNRYPGRSAPAEAVADTGTAGQRPYIRWSAPQSRDSAYAAGSETVSSSSAASGYIARSAPAAPSSAADSAPAVGSARAVSLISRPAAAAPETVASQADRLRPNPDSRYIARSAPEPAQQDFIARSAQEPARQDLATQRYAGDQDRRRSAEARDFTGQSASPAAVDENPSWEDIEQPDEPVTVARSAPVTVREDAGLEDTWTARQAARENGEAREDKWVVQTIREEMAEEQDSARSRGKLTARSEAAAARRDTAARQVDDAQAAVKPIPAKARAGDTAARSKGKAGEVAQQTPAGAGRAVPATAQKTAALQPQKPHWQVQVGAFSQLAAAKQRLSEAVRAAPRVLLQQHSAIQHSPQSGKPLYRVFFKGFDQKQAGTVCRTLKQRQIDCVPVPPA